MDDWAPSAILDARALGRIIALSLTVSVSATALATLLGTPLGAALAVYQFPGRRVLVVLSNAFLGLPPVVVGLALYLLLSRSGPLGTDLGAEYGGALQVDGATRPVAIIHLLTIARRRLLTAVLAGFGRTI